MATKKPTPLPFPEAVARAVRAIPRGQTRSYSQVALYAGRPGAARGVGRELRTLQNVPWWRVIRADHTLAPAVAHEQAQRLRAEGVKVAHKGLVWRVSVPSPSGSR
ncbi:MGMT family protein [Aggregicoccus sp. 17bor-14]|uniref:MGMT family protein n=1 Tax=Myxococcaceae TaxID=31 RepID=UPI00129C21D1|nr:MULTISPECIES: MGMT family protein [Myxococcaceae]MBF5042696.1 MGMT family protein [Simulacricoccus sp. 17bor-14]MRI88464.1 MGMT family protein [Aggregicoccus sp. 17bor-14]